MKKQEIIPINLGDTVHVIVIARGVEYKGQVIHVFPGLCTPNPDLVLKYYGPDAPIEAYEYAESKRYVIELTNPSGYMTLLHTNNFAVYGKEDGITHAVVA